MPRLFPQPVTTVLCRTQSPFLVSSIGCRTTASVPPRLTLGNGSSTTLLSSANSTVRFCCFRFFEHLSSSLAFLAD